MNFRPPVTDFLADHRFLLGEIAGKVGLIDPVAIDPDAFLQPLLEHAVRGALVPIDGVLIRDWDPHGRRSNLGVRVGARLYTIDGIRFVRVSCLNSFDTPSSALDFVAVARSDYLRLYRSAVGCRQRLGEHVAAPVLADGLRAALWSNTINYLDEPNLRRIREYGGRPKRGLLLTGPPGNGKTSACRWLWYECRQRNWEWRLVTADAYASARKQCNPEAAVRALFTVESRGVVFFDDMDLALRDRDRTQEKDDQSVFLNALDGIDGQEGVAFVFTTNCALDLIDPAFKRPGRIDVVLRFDLPDGELRRRLIERWHVDIRGAIDIESAIDETDGFSFAEIDEIKNLMIARFTDAGDWDWDRALEAFRSNRHDFAAVRRGMGFALSESLI